MPVDPSMRALERVIRRPDAPARLEADLPGFLREAGLEGDDLSELAARGALRLKAYRSLVHNRVRNTVEDFIPRTAARLGRARVRADVAAFLGERAISSPYLRDVPREFVEFCLPRWRADPGVPAYLPDLARHELLRLDVKNDPHGGETPTGLKLELDAPVRVDGSAVVMRYDHAVSRLPRDIEDRSLPDATPCCLLAFRGPDQQTQYLDCKPWVAALMERLIAGATLREALLGAVAQVGIGLDDDILGRAAVLLADFCDRGLVLGAEPPT